MTNIASLECRVLLVLYGGVAFSCDDEGLCTGLAVIVGCKWLRSIVWDGKGHLFARERMVFCCDITKVICLVCQRSLYWDAESRLVSFCFYFKCSNMTKVFVFIRRSLLLGMSPRVVMMI